jgi:hypothetical protein
VKTPAVGTTLQPAGAPLAALPTSTVSRYVALLGLRGKLRHGCKATARRGCDGLPMHKPSIVR